MFVNFVMKDKTFRPMIVTVANGDSENGVVIIDGVNDRTNLPDNLKINVDFQTCGWVGGVKQSDGSIPGTWTEVK